MFFSQQLKIVGKSSDAMICGSRLIPDGSRGKTPHHSSMIVGRRSMGVN